MEIILYKLSMPNNGAWNGKWSGESNLYCIIKTYKNKSDIPKKVLSKENFSYDFGDGWRANINCSIIDSKEKVKYKKASNGFCGYDWMVDEIEKNGRIKSLAERQAEKRLIKSK